MPSLADHPASSVVKMLVVGDSGAGKTGALAALADSGYRLRILDFENGLDPLIGHLKKASSDIDVKYETLKDEFNIVGSSIMIKKAPAFQRAMALMNKWDDEDGPVQTWGEDTVLVIDALSSMGRSSLNMVLQANAHLAKPPEIQHWGAAMDNIEKLLGNITNPKLVPCHLVVLTHITYQEQEGQGAVKALPEALGSKLNPKVGRYFNNLISLSLSGSERSFKTKRDGLVACKTSRPIKDKYPIETGLADIFNDLLKKAP
jgi:hypothetical protein